jgi:hypothetical protein
MFSAACWTLLAAASISEAPCAMTSLKMPRRSASRYRETDEVRKEVRRVRRACERTERSIEISSEVGTAERRVSNVGEWCDRDRVQTYFDP